MKKNFPNSFLKKNSFIFLFFLVFLFLCIFLLINNKNIITKLKFVKNILNSEISLNDLNEFNLSNLKNDYNVKFLPETQYQNLKFIKKNIFIPNKNEIKKSNNNSDYNRLDGLNHIEIFNDTLILNTNGGKLYHWKFNSENIENENQLIFNNLSSNMNDIKILDLYLNDNQIFISFINENSDNDCKKFKIASAQINLDYLNFNDFFTSDDCSEKSIYGGRIQEYTHDNLNGILVTTSEVEINNPNLNPQKENSTFGKILFFDFFKKKKVIYSKGHRNPQGLLVDNDKGVILSTEHGPRGGDEINNIKFNKNYGWPISSYGKRYLKNEKNLDLKFEENHLENNYEEPIFSFIPSIGISEIIKIPNTFSSEWQDNYFITSLNDKSIYRIKFSHDFSKVLYLEKIYIGNRIRDIKYHKKMKLFILSLQETSQLGFLYVR